MFSIVDGDKTCSILPNRPNSKGYVYLKHKGRQFRAQRIVYEQNYGKIPDGDEIHHLCEVKACVRPEHLVAVSPGDHRRITGRSEMCPHGHPMLGDNLIVDKKGHRRCLICKREIWRKWKIRRGG